MLEQDLGPYELLVLSFEVLSSDSRVRRRVIDPLSTEGSARTEEGGGYATDEELEVGDGLVGLGFNVEAKVEREVGDLLELAGGARVRSAERTSSSSHSEAEEDGEGRDGRCVHWGVRRAEGGAACSESSREGILLVAGTGEEEEGESRSSSWCASLDELGRAGDGDSRSSESLSSQDIAARP
mgnify:CR=1 FL=1